jgi:hypothetical protein
MENAGMLTPGWRVCVFDRKLRNRSLGQGRNCGGRAREDCGGRWLRDVGRVA